MYAKGRPPHERALEAAKAFYCFANLIMSRILKILKMCLLG